MGTCGVVMAPGGGCLESELMGGAAWVCGDPRGCELVARAAASAPGKLYCIAYCIAFSSRFQLSCLCKGPREASMPGWSHAAAAFVATEFGFPVH